MTKPSQPASAKPAFITPRRGVQIVFMLITLFIGIKFYWFVHQLETGAAVSIERPPGVEAFLPISALVSLKYFLFTGVFNQVHPSALVLFLLICSTALVFRKGFCSWICPIGLLSDVLTRLHQRLFKKPIRVPQWMDWILRGIKYSVAGFFIWNIFIKMPVDALGQFIQSPYNRFADVKMLEFFTQMSSTACIVILVLIGLSILIPNFWCRYLCPYGALLSILSFFSLGKIRRDSRNCINCKKCESVCTGKIQITDKANINSLECSACLKCIDVCPEKNAIRYSMVNRFSLTPIHAAAALIVLFALGITIARQTGHWQNNTTVQDYRQYFIDKQRPLKTFQGMDPEKMKKMIEMMKKMNDSV